MIMTIIIIIIISIIIISIIIIVWNNTAHTRGKSGPDQGLEGFEEFVMRVVIIMILTMIIIMIIVILLLILLMLLILLILRSCFAARRRLIESLEAPVLVLSLRGTKGVPRKGVWTLVNMRVWTCKELRVKHDRASCYLRPPFLGTPFVPPRLS